MELSHEKEQLQQKMHLLEHQLSEKDVEEQKTNELVNCVQMENRKLEMELKRMNEKMFAHEVKNILAVDPSSPINTQLHNLKLELEKTTQENAFLRQKNTYLEAQLRAEENRDRNNPSQQASTLNRPSLRMLREVYEGASSREELPKRLSSVLASQEAEQEDILEINILKKISEEVGELVESNNSLLERIRALEDENAALYDTISAM